jgi:hypothetical protein
LDFYNNQLTGTIPESFGSLTGLTRVTMLAVSMVGVVRHRQCDRLRPFVQVFGIGREQADWHHKKTMTKKMK